ncbi:MAG: tyrosine-type recombinase/integrase [Chloroflexota bacterium]
MHDPARVRVSGPLAPYRVGYTAELARLGYGASGAVLSLRLMADLSVWLEREGLEPEALSTIEVGRFLDARRAAGRRYASAKAIRPPLAYLRGLGVVPAAPPVEPATPLDRLLARYRRYLVVERSLAPATASCYLAAVRPFLSTRIRSDGLALEGLTIVDVTAFVVTHCPEQPRGSAKLTVTSLRSLLGFLHLEAILPHPLAGSVPRTAAWRLAALPHGLTRAEVERLLAACDRRRATGRRDVAVITLLVRLGLRAGEVAALTLDAIDWRAGELVVAGKGNRAERLPLPADAGEAIVAYLRRGRPATALDRAVFIRAKAPHRGLTSGGVSQIVGDAARRAGLGVVHAHRLRHTAATAMLAGGGSLAEIGQVLRHRRSLTTAIYAKVDVRALRTLARPWPGGAA